MTSSVKLHQVPRARKAAIAVGIQANLLARQQHGPAEPALDAFVPELGELGQELSFHVSGHVTADAARETRLEKLDRADEELDTRCRHIHGYLAVEALRREDPRGDLARALLGAAFPHGLSRVDAHVAVQNLACRRTLQVLTDPEHAAALAALELPGAWIASLAAALDASDAALGAVTAARREKTHHVVSGKDAEVRWVDLMVRLRGYVRSRARRGDRERAEEGRALLAPLLDALKKMRAEAAARAAREGRGESASPSATIPG